MTTAAAIRQMKLLQAELGVEQDGRMGPVTLRALNKLIDDSKPGSPDVVIAALRKLRVLQQILKVKVDGIVGPVTLAALNKVHELSQGIISGMVSSFADPADIVAFKKCKQRGLSDVSCFKEGDNGIGKWGADTTQDRPMCALPREDWAHLAKPAGTPVLVTANGKTILCELQDTLPAKRNVKHGVVIDLNPAAVKALGLKPPILVRGAWRWAT